ncbi:DUF4198 domain-containing protein [Aestuariibius insulae]|uniref:DUF4198 domain-containing protein n=1 Tax=Aestuariibius insulae TaxID=2058287 RepID=UPI00345EB761
MRILAALLALCPAGLASAHEFWIEPVDYQVATGDPLAAHIVNGEEFEGTRFAFFPQRFQRFEVTAGNGTDPLGGRPGDMPAAQLDNAEDGLVALAYVSMPAKVRYETFDKFLSFAEHKDFAGITALHNSRDLPKQDFVESYTRYARTLIAVGDGGGEDAPSGLETEIVALANPYTAPLDGVLPVRVLYLGDPRPDAQVELFEKAPDGAVDITLHRTDTEGVALLPVRPGHSYLADAVILREPLEAALAANPDAVWETLWASLTFAVPGTDPS